MSPCQRHNTYRNIACIVVNRRVNEDRSFRGGSALLAELDFSPFTTIVRSFTHRPVRCRSAQLTQEGSREESRNGGAGDDKRRRSRSRDRIDDTGGNDEPKGLERSTNNDALGEEGRRKAGGWRCGHCTFQNASDTGQACAMCGHTRVIATTATAGCSPAPFKKRTVQEVRGL